MAELSRRDFVSRAGVAAAAVVLGGPALAEAAPDLRRWSAVRAQFALDPKRIHLASFLLAAHPRAVREAIERHRRGLDRDAVTYLHANEGRLTSDARAAAGRYLGVPAGEVALTDSTTMGLGLLYTRLELKPSEEVLTTEHDFYATHEALRLAGRASSARPAVRRSATASVDEIVTRLRRGISERTRVVALTWVHSSTGVKLPIRAIADVAARTACSSASTACTASAVEDASARELALRRLRLGLPQVALGPRGTGVLWANGRVRELMRPTIPSFDDGASYGAWLAGTSPAGIADGARQTPGGFHSFEHRWALPERSVSTRPSGGRASGEGARARTEAPGGLLGDTGRSACERRAGAVSAGLVCFEVAGLDPAVVVQRLAARRIVASVTPYAQRYVRLGPGIVNTPAEIDAAVRAIATL